MRIDYDSEAKHYRAGREVPLEALEPWRSLLGSIIPPGEEPLLDLGAGTGLWTRAFGSWFGAAVVALEPSSGMREVGAEIGLPSGAQYVAASAECLPFDRGTFRAAWLSTVVHHLSDMGACARELRRVLGDGGPVMIRNSFSGRLDEVELFKYFPAGAAVAANWPSVDQLLTTFAAAGFVQHRVVRVREKGWRDLEQLRDFAVAMRSTDSALVPISDGEFAEGLGNLERAIARRDVPGPTGTDLVILR
jgi:ubiquinone/menaquinone biosynthesis C-methylase UbiE